MSSKEARRPGLVQAALAGRITNAEAALALGLSVRQFRRLRAAHRRAGVQGLLHGNRGRPAHNRLGTADRQRLVQLINERYRGLNDSHLTEKLRELEGLSVSRETVRRLRIAEGHAPVRRRRAPQHRRRRLREARRGAMVLVDASEHRWFGDREPCWNLLGAVDDASGAIVALHFRREEDLHGYTELLRRIATTHGLPGTLYGDRLAVFVRNDKHWTLEEELAGEQDRTQFGQMLAELAVGFIAAQSPQAKGRIERLWETLQDRLVHELRLRTIVTVEGTEAYLPRFIADFNRRFARPPRESISAWRRAPRDLERILACRYLRSVARDNTVTLPGRWIQLTPGPGQRSWHKCRVEVRERLDGRLQVFHRDRLIGDQPWERPSFTLVPRSSGGTKQRRARLGVNLPGSPLTADRSPVRLKTRGQKQGLGHYTHRRKPKPSHLWYDGYRHAPPLPPKEARGRT